GRHHRLVPHGGSDGRHGADVRVPAPARHPGIRGRPAGPPEAGTCSGSSCSTPGNAHGGHAGHVGTACIRSGRL
ncbi:MAG: hypothetical protein AVDCRST_MAG34-2074, partial [uncultured Nocardioidaceae bacterium]